MGIMSMYDIENINPSKHHDLKCLTKYYQEIENGIKTFEVRYNDRNYKKFDILHLKEFVPPETYTGREMSVEVVYVLSDENYCKEGFVVLGIRRIC